MFDFYDEQRLLIRTEHNQAGRSNNLWPGNNYLVTEPSSSATIKTPDTLSVSQTETLQTKQLSGTTVAV
jgi:hypothetical protein